MFKIIFLFSELILFGPSNGKVFGIQTRLADWRQTISCIDGDVDVVDDDVDVDVTVASIYVVMISVMLNWT